MRRMNPLPTDRPALMGIVNVTPDSFSDGGQAFQSGSAIELGMRLIEEGADLVDVGGESTRPGSQPVPLEEELRRVLPVVSALAKEGVRLSIDTSKPEVAKACLEAGAWMVNDVTALGVSDGILSMAEVCTSAKCAVCLMHMQGTPATMQDNPSYEDVVAEVKAFLLERTAHTEAAGIQREKIWIDPGIGFGKTLGHNLALLGNLEQFVATGYKVLIGVSRKGFLGQIASPGGPLPMDQRLEATLAVQTLAQAKGVSMIRAHDVHEARRAIDATAAVIASGR